MKKAYLFSLILGLGGLMLAGFSFGYYWHLCTSLQRFARETDRTSTDYDFSVAWVQPPDGGQSYPVILAIPAEDSPTSFQAQTRWRWSVSNPEEPCHPGQHRLIWRFGKDSWELVDDLEKDLSLPLFPDGEGDR